MSQDKPKLSSHSLKLSDDDLVRIKIACAKNSDFKFQYQFFDAAVFWAEQNKASIQPVANKKSGSYRSYYLDKAEEALEGLEKHWDCSITRALYTAVVGYISACETATEALQQEAI
tara:strand:+ start:54008 stop:54355 length:348 start_codon:yes stop_codon:yes gene_type:complete